MESFALVARGMLSRGKDALVNLGEVPLGTLRSGQVG